MEDLRQQVGSNMMDGGIDELRQGVGNMMVGGVVPVPNHANNVHRRSKTRVTMHALMSEALPLDEAARLEMKALPNKTPVSVLQELLSRRGTTPKYELVQIEGAIHEPTFRYRVTVADVVAMGTGRSKKEAKHAAAKAVLDKLIGVNTENAEAPIPNSIPDENFPLSSQNIQEIQSGYGEEKVVNNPIGSLQEMCMSRHWPPPKYSMEGEEGLPHERQFTIVCSILKYRQVGQGKSKKLAKRQAAHKMWQSLQDTNSNRTQGVDEDEIVQRNANVNAHYADLKDSKIATLTTPHSHKVSQFHKNLKSSTGVKLFELQTHLFQNTCLNDGDVNLVQFLQEIASEQQFEVTYVDIEEKSISGKCQCLVQLSTLPVAVCYGSGMTSKDAQAAAAQNALEYLKIMTKK
ncbi:interferon-inducible double-stranded RNA-dependent protein kinase activator A isoform X1 [Nasonia vitripennis]|uniref:DRBM domain-containing protein n=1 Tax=Nasonia vitripennis TaxID=7425 RepID=A0A7M7IS27_NASVI|nr:interferon-inducible double-stranded RNA-dependent protein kinase activator A isoform X1 [Nasonia vitripennis]XP_016839606.1 interferon-inducible double-stranded RNA-dependent protein kinase activator A isoform X1 [Nasonia vitripennis]XP_016839607.1 interferon-inducible double-stranded RNA-dependent protein kinase activator A isoform X1 [Nasonia vitripennis]